MIKYVIHAKKWFDKVNGNTYHSVRVLDTVRQLQLKVPFQYGYGNHYITTSQDEMIKQGWIKENFKHTDFLNLHYICEEDCKKKDVVAWGKVA
tara:strand:+ start:562 stop:840 length:279 start_codon:yes stop_codon:yes gene_type:complete